jgi:CheY-like chemotaxis protein
MDLQMPGMGGLEAARKIRTAEEADGGARRVPIIALTASVMEEDRAEALAAGMDGFLPKPFKQPDLFAILDAHLKPAAPDPETKAAPVSKTEAQSPNRKAS